LAHSAFEIPRLWRPPEKEILRITTSNEVMGTSRRYPIDGSSSIFNTKGWKWFGEGFELARFYLDFSQDVMRQAIQEAITLCKDANTISSSTRTTGEGSVQVDQPSACRKGSLVIQMQG
jgi:hypothetical protein